MREPALETATGSRSGPLSEGRSRQPSARGSELPLLYLTLGDWMQWLAYNYLP